MSGINFWKFFLKIWTGFCSVTLFSRPGVIFCVCVCLLLKKWIYIKNEYILDNNSCIWVQKVNKKLFDFSNNKLPIETGIVNSFHYIWGIWVIHKSTNFNNRVKIWWHNLKSHMKLLFWYFLKDLMCYHTQAKFHTYCLTCSGFMEGYLT